MALVQCLLAATSMGYVRKVHKETGLTEAEKAEYECVFRELLLKHGPFFLWASVSIDPLHSQWVSKLMATGLDELKLYEAGRPRASSMPPLHMEKKRPAILENVGDYRRKTTRSEGWLKNQPPSLQSVLLNTLCKMEGCQPAFVWDRIYSRVHVMIRNH
jgi:hypothetical protein